MVYHKKKGMKTMKVRKLKRKTRRHKRRLGGRGSVFSSIMDSSDTNTDKKHSNKTEKHSNKTKRQSNLTNTFEVMGDIFKQEKKRSGTFTTRNNKKQMKNGLGTKRKRKRLTTLPNKKPKLSIHRTNEFKHFLPIHMKPEPRRATKPPTDSDDSN